MSSQISQNLDVLKKAQQLDVLIHQSRLQLEEMPYLKKQLKDELESKKNHLREIEKAAKDIQVKLKEKELELSQKENQIKKLDGQLSQVRTNKEYSALQQEIASLKADNSILEEGIIQILDEVEAIKEDVKKEKENFTAIEKEYQQKDVELNNQEKNIQTQLEDALNKRSSTVDVLPPEIKDLYNRIAEKKEGRALARVVNGVCLACQLQLRPQLINEIKIGVEITVCENCSRILYIED